jgi:hypothetical protein
MRALLDEEKNARRVFWKDVPDLAGNCALARRCFERLARRMADCTARCLQQPAAELLLAQALAQIANSRLRR